MHTLTEQDFAAMENMPDPTPEQLRVLGISIMRTDEGHAEIYCPETDSEIILPVAMFHLVIGALRNFHLLEIESVSSSPRHAS